MKYGNGSLLCYFDYDFAEGFYFTGAANPAERQDIVSAGEHASRDAHDQNVSLAGSLRSDPCIVPRSRASI